MNIEHRPAVLVAALAAAFMVFVDATIVNVTLPQLAGHLDASRSELEWAVNGYTGSFAAVMLGAGAICDSLGAKPAFLGGLAAFTCSSGVCALSGSIDLLILARVAQGAGAALLLPSALVLATASAPDEGARHRLVGRWAAAGGAGMAAGPLLGGALTAFADWRAVFAVNVVIGAPAALWSARAMPRTATRKGPVDVRGMAGATSLIGGLVFALIQSSVDGWDSPAAVAAMGVALIGLLAFVSVERHAPSPLLPPAVYRDRRFISAVAQGALFNFAFYGLLFALSLLLAQGRGLGPLTSGLLFIPLTGLISVATLCAAPLARRGGRPLVSLIAQTSLTGSLLAIAWSSTATSLWPLVLALIPAGFSGGLLVPTLTSEAISAVEPRLHGAASAAFNTARQVGGAIGVATVGPLLGSGSLAGGFVRCLLACAAAAAAAMVIATVTQLRRRSWCAAPGRAPATTGATPPARPGHT